MASNGGNNDRPSLSAEIGPDGLARESPLIAYTEKIIEDERLQLRKYIDENYSKIRDVERELTNLTMEMKLTAGPKKAALEHLRKKIEISTERIRNAKLKEEEAQKAWEAASKAVKDQEALKQKLCEDLSNLVQESSNSQFVRLEELKRRLQDLNPGRSSTTVAPDANQAGPTQSATTPSVSSAPSTVEPPAQSSGHVSNQGNGGNLPVKNNQNQQKSEDILTDGRVKKKNVILGRGRGIGAIPKGRGPEAPGWTGSGFDVDGTTCG